MKRLGEMVDNRGGMYEFTWDANRDVLENTWNPLNFRVTKSLSQSSAGKSTGTNKALLYRLPPKWRIGKPWF